MPIDREELKQLLDIERQFKELSAERIETPMTEPATTEAARDADSDDSMEETKAEMTFGGHSATDSEADESEIIPAKMIQMMPAKVGAASESPALQAQTVINMEIVSLTKPSAEAAIQASQKDSDLIESHVLEDHLLLFWDNSNAHHGFVKQFNTLLKKRQRFDELNEDTYDALERFRARDPKRFPNLRYMGGYQ